VSVSLRRDVVILACAASAGIHGALTRAHFAESAAAGAGFAATTIVLALFAAVLTWYPYARLPLGLAALTLGGLIASYALTVTTGLPVLHPEPEPVTGLAVVTKAIEAAGLVAASSLLPRRRAVAFRNPQPKGT
jgi:hypothetical protein